MEPVPPQTPGELSTHLNDPTAAPGAQGQTATHPASARRAAGRTYLVAIVATAAAGAALTFTVLNAGSDVRARAESRPVAAANSRAATRERVAQEDVAHGWSTDNAARWISNHPRSAAFERAADQTVAAWMTRIRPVLVVRCLSGRLDAFVYTESAANLERRDEDHEVRIAFDGEAHAVERWSDSAEHDALFTPDAAQFTRRIAAARSLRFGFTPHNAPPVDVTFDLRGFEEPSAALSRHCGRR